MAKIHIRNAHIFYTNQRISLYLLIAKGRPFITAEFNSGNPHIRPRQFKDEKAGTIANSGGRYVVHNLDAYSFARAHMLLRGVPKGCIDEVVNNLMDKVASKLNSREAMLQFYAVMEIPPPEGFDDFYPAQPMPQQPL